MLIKQKAIRCLFRLLTVIRINGEVIEIESVLITQPDTHHHSLPRDGLTAQSQTQPEPEPALWLDEAVSPSSLPIPVGPPKAVT